MPCSVSSVGRPIVDQLPYNLQEKWVFTASAYKSKENVVFPPFSEFAKFVQRQAKIRNDPGLFPTTTEQSKPSFVDEPRIKTQTKDSVKTRKTDIEDTSNQCMLHKTNSHSLDTCRSFKSKTYNDRKQFIRPEIVF